MKLHLSAHHRLKAARNWYRLSLKAGRKNKEKRVTKKRMTAEERRQSLIESTIKVVARLNYDRATTALIAKEAGVNEALIYNHFKSKTELQLATLDYLLEFRLGLYKANPIFKEENKEESIIRALNAQYLQVIQSPEINMFACILKAMFALDPKIREKGVECCKAFYEFSRENINLDKKRGFFKGDYSSEIIAWEMMGRILLVATLAVNERLEIFGIQNIKKSIDYFDEIYLSNNK
jgi:AcrR family transcriptional regulator